jgi:hypothetical protein
MKNSLLYLVVLVLAFLSSLLPPATKKILYLTSCPSLPPVLIRWAFMWMVYLIIKKVFIVLEIQMACPGENTQMEKLISGEGENLEAI